MGTHLASDGERFTVYLGAASRDPAVNRIRSKRVL
jgi:hypothetical protein